MLTYCVLFLTLLFSAAVSYAEEIKITTYFPSPYGVYQTLRLFPGTAQNPNLGACPNPGEIFYYNGMLPGAALAGLYFCDGVWNSWKPISAGPSALWDIDVVSREVYNTNNPVGWVRVGTADPAVSGGKFQVIGGVANSAGSPIGVNMYLDNSAASTSPIGLNLDLAGGNAGVYGMKAHVDCVGSTAAGCVGGKFDVTNVASAAPVYALDLSAASPTATGSSIGVRARGDMGNIAYGARLTGNGGLAETYGLDATATGVAAGNAYGVRATASGSAHNWAGYFENGDVYMRGNLGVGAMYPSQKKSKCVAVAFFGMLSAPLFLM